MVTRLNEEELMLYISDNRPEGVENLRLNLNISTINQWIEDGTFAFIKKELQQYHNLKFGCLKHDEGCQYFFITENNNVALTRLAQFFDKLMGGKKVPLYKLSTEQKSLRYESPRWIIPNCGTYNACPLF